MRQSSILTGTSFSGTNTLVGSYNPNWRNQIRNGLGATTPLSGTLFSDTGSLWLSSGVEVIDKVTGKLAGTEEIYGYLPLYNPFGGITVSSSAMTDIENRCIRKFLSACHSAQSSVEAGQDLGEWKETREGMMRPLQSLRHQTLAYLDEIKNISLSKHWKGPGLVNAISDTFLEFKFGWDPLAADIGAAYAGLRDRRAFDTQPVEASASGLIGGNDFLSTNWLVGTYFKIQSHNVFNAHYSVRMKGSIRTGAVNGLLPYANVLQLSSLPDITRTIWDLLPYSFIVDYFVNVGNIIDGLSFRFADMAWGQVTRRTTYNYNYGFNLVGFGSNAQSVQGTSWLDYGNPSLKKVTFTRNVLTSSDLIPRVEFSLPRSAKPWENMAAILAGRLSFLKPLGSALRKAL